jgi:transposase-like protein
MAKVDGPELAGTVGVNETYVGGKQRRRAGKPKNKAAVIVIRELGVRLHFVRVNEANKIALGDLIARNADKAVHVIMVDASKVDNFNPTQEPSAFSPRKHGIVGTWYQVSAKHLTAYLQEMAWRFNNRTNPYAFRDTMTKLIRSPRIECKKLVASESGSLMSFSWRRNLRQWKMHSR